MSYITDLLLQQNNATTELDLLLKDVPVITNIYQQGQYSAALSGLMSSIFEEISYEKSGSRPPVKEVIEMLEKDPVAARSVALKALRAVQRFGVYTQSHKECQDFIQSNLNTLTQSFKRTLFDAIVITLQTGSCFIEFTTTPNAIGYKNQWRLKSLNILDPEKIQKVIARNGALSEIVYDNGGGKIVNIPYAKCIHIVNNNSCRLNHRAIFGVSEGAIALKYTKLKKYVLTQLALATKSQSQGILHAKTPNNGRTILVDSKMQPVIENGKPKELTKQAALCYQLQDLHKKDYIVTGIDVELDPIQVKSDWQFWEYVLKFIDRAIEQSYGIPVGIFDSGPTSLANTGLSGNFKSVFDSTINSLVDLVKEELINKIVKKLLIYNFPPEYYKDGYGDFSFDNDDDQDTINSRLSTIASLAASGLLDPNDPDILSLIKKSLGLPVLDDIDKKESVEKQEKTKYQEDLQIQLQEMQAQMQLLQLQQQMMMMQNPQAMGSMPPEQGAAPAEGGVPEDASMEYPPA